MHNGVVYIAWFDTAVASGLGNPRVFGVRVDDAVQGLRDFIIESALMQDFDDASKPNGMARYQTHLTVIDNNKAPLANEPVRLGRPADQR